jgi:hypothetical protein
VDTLNVWQEQLPDFDHEAIGAKYKAVKRETMTEAESNVWERIQSLIQRFRSADRIVIGTPMWNFGLPYKLKQLIDLVAQRNYLFTYDGKQYGPLLYVEKAVAVYTPGSRFLRRLVVELVGRGSYDLPPTARDKSGFSTASIIDRSRLTAQRVNPWSFVWEEFS